MKEGFPSAVKNISAVIGMFIQHAQDEGKTFVDYNYFKIICIPLTKSVLSSYYVPCSVHLSVLGGEEVDHEATLCPRSQHWHLNVCGFPVVSVVDTLPVGQRIPK